MDNIFGKHTKDVWELLNELADISDNMENTVSLLQDAQEYLSDAFDELASQIEDIEEDLRNCNSRLYELNHSRENSVSTGTDDMPF